MGTVSGEFQAANRRRTGDILLICPWWAKMGLILYKAFWGSEEDYDGPTLYRKIARQIACHQSHQRILGLLIDIALDIPSLLSISRHRATVKLTLRAVLLLPAPPPQASVAIRFGLGCGVKR